MDRGRLKLTSWMVRRGLVYVLVIGGLLLLGMPAADAGSVPRGAGISSGAGSAVGTSTRGPLSIPVGNRDHGGLPGVVCEPSHAFAPYDLTAWQNTAPYGTWIPFVARRFPYHCDDFSDRTNGWYVGDLGNVKYAYVDGEYEILLRKKSWSGAAVAPIDGFTRGIIDADMHLHQGTVGAYGLIFGLVDWDHFYLFIVDPNPGYYSLWRAEPTEWVPLITWHYSGYILRSPAVNHLQVRRNTDRGGVYVNGRILGNYHDDAYTDGLGVGVLAHSWYEQPIAVRFDNWCTHAKASEIDTTGTSLTPQGETPGGRGPLPPPAP